MNEELKSYVASLRVDTLSNMDEYQIPEMAFVATVLDKIEDLFDCKEIIKDHCRLCKSNGDVLGELHAYALSTNEEVLYLFYSYYNPLGEVQCKTCSDGQVALNRLQGFYNSAIRGAHLDLDEGSPEYEAGRFIYDNLSKIQSINLVVLSNYVINNLSLKKIRIASKPVFSDVWDLKKIYGNTHSLSDHVAIDIDFDSDEYNRYKIPFIQMESTQYGYKCIQAMFPAKLLYQLYERYNTNLLFNNVRYFLGLKGAKEKKPNVAMLDTLRKSNEMFLAYNNGITALAKGIESEMVGERTDVTDPDSKCFSQYISMGVLKRILDFRIINGGQTTAVIYNARSLSDSTKDPNKKVNLLGVYVQVKLIISDNIEKMSGDITMSSNFQNKVQYSDFSVGNEFNTKMENLSRSVVVPNRKRDLVYWFYERLRGQYDEKKKRICTKADKEYFEYQYPKKYKFSKEEVAKVWMSWKQHPYDAVKGAATTYATFMKEILSRNFVPDELFYKETIALLIVYRFLMSRPENKAYGNAKATVVAYALATLSNLTLENFDLLKIWENQDVSSNTKVYLNALCERIYQLFSCRVTEQGNSILSFGKSKPAYEYLRSQRIGIDLHLLDEDLIRQSI